MTDRELMQMALEAMEHLHRTGDTQVFDLCYAPELIPALRERLAQPVVNQQLTTEPPCKTSSQCIGGKCERCIQPEQDDGYCQACEGNHCTAKDGCVARDNPPPQREWQGLTDEEVWEMDAYKMAITDQEMRWLYRFARAIEAKLKAKNHG